MGIQHGVDFVYGESCGHIRNLVVVAVYGEGCGYGVGSRVDNIANGNSRAARVLPGVRYRNAVRHVLNGEVRKVNRVAVVVIPTVVCKGYIFNAVVVDFVYGKGCLFGRYSVIVYEIYVARNGEGCGNAVFARVAYGINSVNQIPTAACVLLLVRVRNSTDSELFRICKQYRARRAVPVIGCARKSNIACIELYLSNGKSADLRSFAVIFHGYVAVARAKEVNAVAEIF